MENLSKSNNHWNGRKCQFNWYKINWVDPKNQYLKNNPLRTSTYKFYIKDGNELCHFVGHPKLKLIDYGAFFNHKEFSAVLESSVGSTDVGKESNNVYIATHKSVQDKSNEVSIKKIAVKVSKENRSDCDEIYINVASSYFEKEIYLTNKYDGKTQRRTIYEAIYDSCITAGN